VSNRWMISGERQRRPACVRFTAAQFLAQSASMVTASLEPRHRERCEKICW
jgi:hypothetical protein